jgi:hypothetical protein
MPEGPRLEAGPVQGGAMQGAWRVRASATAALGNDGSHPEEEGVDAGGATVPAPLHEHVVEINNWRTVVDLEYRATDDLAFRLKMPFEVRERSARVRLVEPATAAEQAAMQRNLDYHHRDATLEGARDFEITAATWWHGVFSDSDYLEFSSGCTLPVGETESNPYARDAFGNVIPHEHVQFGTGTLDPIVQVTWSRRFGEQWAGNLYGAARLPLYENRHDFRAPREFTLAGGVSRALGEHWHLRGTLTTLYSGFAEWNETRDPNSGWFVHYAGFGAEWRGESLTAALLVQFPFGQQVLGAGDETFDLGQVISLSLLLPL